MSLLAERPRPVGVLAELAGARQPQTTKHLQTLERAGVVTSRRSGQRRVYALRSAPLRELAAVLGRLADAATLPGGPQETHDHCAAKVIAERAAGGGARVGRRPTADGRRPGVHVPPVARTPARAGPAHLTEASLLCRWWVPDDLRVSEFVFEAREGGRIVQEYRDAEDTDGSDEVVGRAEGTVEDVRPAERLVYRLSPVLPDGGLAFTAHVDLELRPTGTGTDLDVHWRIAESSVDSADFIAGIEIGFGQSTQRTQRTQSAPAVTAAPTRGA